MARGAVADDHADAEADQRGEGDVEQRPQRPGGEVRSAAELDAADARRRRTRRPCRWRRGPARPPRRVIVLAATVTQRAGRAVRVTARVPCWASPVNMRIPVTAASIATSGSG